MTGTNSFAKLQCSLHYTLDFTCANFLSLLLLLSMHWCTSIVLLCAGSGLLYGPTLPDFAVWHRKGFACTSQLRNIKAETWGASTREPRDPKAIPPQYAYLFINTNLIAKIYNARFQCTMLCRKHVPAFDKRGFPADVSRQAELPVAWGTEVTCKRPSTSCTASAAIHQKNVPQRAKTADDGVSRPGAKAMRNHKKVVSTTKACILPLLP